MILPLRMLEIQHRVMGIINPPTVVLSIICSPSDVSLPSFINPTHGHTLPLFSPQQKTDSNSFVSYSDRSDRLLPVWKIRVGLSSCWFQPNSAGKCSSNTNTGRTLPKPKQKPTKIALKYSINLSSCWGFNSLICLDETKNTTSIQADGWWESPWEHPEPLLQKGWGRQFNSCNNIDLAFRSLMSNLVSGLN